MEPVSRRAFIGTLAAMAAMPKHLVLPIQAVELPEEPKPVYDLLLVGANGFTLPRHTGANNWSPWRLDGIDLPQWVLLRDDMQSLSFTAMGPKIIVDQMRLIDSYHWIGTCHGEWFRYNGAVWPWTEGGQIIDLDGRRVELGIAGSHTNLPIAVVSRTFSECRIRTRSGLYLPSLENS